MTIKFKPNLAALTEDVTTLKNVIDDIEYRFGNIEDRLDNIEDFFNELDNFDIENRLTQLEQDCDKLINEPEYDEDDDEEEYDDTSSMSEYDDTSNMSESNNCNCSNSSCNNFRRYEKALDICENLYSICEQKLDEAEVELCNGDNDNFTINLPWTEDLLQELRKVFEDLIDEDICFKRLNKGENE
jgi:hypothetical protein